MITKKTGTVKEHELRGPLCPGDSVRASFDNGERLWIDICDWGGGNRYYGRVEAIPSNAHREHLRNPNSELEIGDPVAVVVKEKATLTVVRDSTAGNQEPGSHVPRPFTANGCTNETNNPQIIAPDSDRNLGGQ